MQSESIIETSCGKLRRTLDEAVGLGSVERIVPAVKQGLERVIADGEAEVPKELCQPDSDGYARRLLYRNPDLGYTVLVMTWGVGQGTPLHDHAGLWCVEGVWRGALEVVQYDLLEESNGHCRFEAQVPVRAGVGSAGSLIPPYDYHTIANALEDEISVTLHVYGGEMDHCSVFLPERDAWYRREEHQLALN